MAVLHLKRALLYPGISEDESEAIKQQIEDMDFIVFEIIKIEDAEFYTY